MLKTPVQTTQLKMAKVKKIERNKYETNQLNTRKISNILTCYYWPPMLLTLRGKISRMYCETHL